MANTNQKTRLQSKIPVSVKFRHRGISGIVFLKVYGIPLRSR